MTYEEALQQFADNPLVVDAIRKRIPQKPHGDLHSVPHYRCPNCQSSVKTFCDSPRLPYCSFCGQALDWRHNK